MDIMQELDFTKVIAVVTVLSSAISIIINKIFENQQNSLKHKRLIEEKIINTKLDACKSAIKYYGTYLSYLHNSKSTLESLESYEYSLLLNESNKFYEESLKKIYSDGEFQTILLFYDFYGEDDEKISEKLKEKLKDYYGYVNKNEAISIEKEKELRLDLIQTMNEAIKYFKKKIKIVRDDLGKTIK